MNRDLRIKFFKILGDAYHENGIPEIIGWIEALMSIKKSTMTQKEISDELTSLFNDIDNPTSVSSVNRAIKTMLSLDLLNKEGSRKIGYKYSLNSDFDLITNVFQTILASNKKFLKRISRLRDDSGIKNDKDLISSIENQWEIYTTLQNSLEGILESLKKNKSEK